MSVAKAAVRDDRRTDSCRQNRRPPREMPKTPIWRRPRSQPRRANAIAPHAVQFTISHPLPRQSAAARRLTVAGESRSVQRLAFTSQGAGIPRAGVPSGAEPWITAAPRRQARCGGTRARQAACRTPEMSLPPRSCDFEVQRLLCQRRSRSTMFREMRTYLHLQLARRLA